MLGKAAIIERSLRRVREIYADDPKLKDVMHVDALTLNLERACQAAIDLAMHVVAVDHLGMPHGQADAFRLLADADRLDRKLSETMTGMTGFRNILIHQYQDINMDILHHVARKGWRDIAAVCESLGLRVEIDQDPLKHFKSS